MPLNHDEKFRLYCESQLDQDYAAVATHLGELSALAFDPPSKFTAQERELLSAMYHVAEDACTQREVLLRRAMDLEQQVTNIEKGALVAEIPQPSPPPPPKHYQSPLIVDHDHSVFDHSMSPLRDSAMYLPGQNSPRFRHAPVITLPLVTILLVAGTVAGALFALILWSPR